MSEPRTKNPSRQARSSIGVFTSGGDAPGMNAAVRAVVRTALDRGIRVYAIREGYQGMVDGGDGIRPMRWGDVSGILHLGGTSIGTARCQAFRERAGRLKAAANLLAHGIDRLVVIGGDGSLTGANLFRQEWPGLVDELVAKGEVSAEVGEAHPDLGIVGLVGSIDNDMSGTDMTIGADTALRRITDAVDAITSTAASHQRTFIIEVMGRNCGYLALMGALATGADWVILPESPPTEEDWEAAMCDTLASGLSDGRRDTIILLSEGARDRHGEKITSAYVREVLEERLGLDTRVTILGHVQRGGAPSAYDRYMSTVLGHAAVDHVEHMTPDEEPKLIGMQGNRVAATPLMEAVRRTHSVADAIQEGDYDAAIERRGGSFREALAIFRTLARARPKPPRPEQHRLTIAMLNASGPAPGMNAASRAAIRLALNQGHEVLGVDHGFQGLVNGEIRPLHWMDVEHWTSMGGSELGTNRHVPDGGELYAIARNLEAFSVDALLVIGGWAGYEAAHRLVELRDQYPVFKLPIVCLPASINNNLPGSEFSVGADTALNNIVEVVDKIKQSAVASQRTFVVEVMGRYCGYLALMSGLATGAERVYMHEEGVTLADLKRDVERLTEGFEEGKRLGLMIRGEYANRIYTTPFMCALFEEEGGDLFSVRQAILGHLQQGGSPAPFDRIQATRLAAHSVDYLIEHALAGSDDAAMIGLQQGRVAFTPLTDFPGLIDAEHKRPAEQWWMALRPIARVLAQNGPT